MRSEHLLSRIDSLKSMVFQETNGEIVNVGFSHPAPVQKEVQKKEVQKEVQVPVQKKSTDKQEPNLDKEKGKEEIDVIEC